MQEERGRKLVAAVLLPLAGLALWSLAGCATVSARDASAREWEHAQCNQITRAEDRRRCLERVDAEYGKAR